MYYCILCVSGKKSDHTTYPIPYQLILFNIIHPQRDLKVYVLYQRILVVPTCIHFNFLP